MNWRISYGCVPQVLLLGNGINRSFNFSSWDKLLDSISEKTIESVDEVPYPFRAILLTKDNINEKLKTIAFELSEMHPPAEEKEQLHLLAKPFDVILTTNYTYEIEKSLCSNFNVAIKSPSKQRKVVYKDATKFSKAILHTCFEIPNTGKSVWHIHGEAAKPDTIILGHYFYGKVISAMQHYLSNFLRRYKASLKAKRDFECRSWIDYFLVGNVTIIGLGLDLSEIDLWWLINAKKRHFANSHLTFYKPDIKKSERLLAEAYGMQIAEACFNGNYKEYYLKAIREISPK